MSKQSIEKGIFALSNLGKWVAGITLGLSMLLTTADVVWRYFLNHSIVAAHDVTELMMVVVVFLGLAYTASVKGHIRVDLLISKLSERAQAILDSITTIFSIVIFAVMAWRTRNARLAFDHPRRGHLDSQNTNRSFSFFSSRWMCNAMCTATIRSLHFAGAGSKEIVRKCTQK